MPQRAAPDRWVLLVLAIGLVVCAGPAAPRRLSAGPDVAPAPAGTPPSVALAPPLPTLRLPRNFEPTAYQVTLAIDPARDDFDGTVAIAGQVSERSAVIWLNAHGLTVATASASDGQRQVALTATARADEFLELRAAEPLAAGAWTVTIAYRGRFADGEWTGAFKQVEAGAPYVFTQLQYVFARRVFPCVDEPDRRTPWQLTLDVPTGVVALANTPARATSALDAGHTRYEFEATPPLPSYLIAFAVGPLELIELGASRGGAPMRLVTTRGRTAEARYAAATLPRVLALLEDWFGTPYPYAKLDLVAVPFGYGAMENVGLVMINGATSLMDPARATWAQREEWIVTATHELAHMWFGNLATNAWWDDLWLHEGFATWIEAPITAQFEPRWSAGLRALDKRRDALAVDGRASARPVRQPLTDLSQFTNLVDEVNYQKAASVIAMVEAAMGPAAFQQAVRAYLAAHAGGLVTTADLLAQLAAAGRADLGPVLASFLDQPSVPVVTAALRCDGDRGVVSLAQQRDLPPDVPTTTARWQVPVCVVFDDHGGRAVRCTTLVDATVDLELGGCPRWYWPNAAGAGYFRAVLPPADLRALRDHGWAELTIAERRVVTSDALVAVERGQAELPDAMRLVADAVATDRRFEVGDAIAFAQSLALVVPTAALPAYQRWVRASFGPLARRLGWRARPGDDIDAEAIRPKVLALVAGAGDPAIAKAARALAWRNLPPGVRRPALALIADTPVGFHRLKAALATTTDAEARGDLLRALGASARPELQDEALALSLDPSLAPLEALFVLFSSEDEAARDRARAYFRSHQDAILGRLPEEFAFVTKAYLARLFKVCEASQRDATVAYVQATFAGYGGGAYEVAQVVDGIDACVARKARLGPALASWLATR